MAKGVRDSFEIPRIMRAIIDLAVKNGTMRGSTVWALALNHGTNWDAMRQEILLYAFNNRHSERGLKAHSELCKLNDEYYRVHCMNLAPTIHFD